MKGQLVRLTNPLDRQILCYSCLLHGYGAVPPDPEMSSGPGRRASEKMASRSHEQYFFNKLRGFASFLC